ncbi:hypothetical protein LTR36_003152 [Oleoguttula mirabilis]|uniref:Uncharacterized protein n=1 Tax=Oleoguttula mirabilis TaxID=1507867 RepID=A0AAV9JXA0_9PEZI|nr:hypothetical protein LTR36_003152 [Oleoguttula mirabilis]
MQLTTILLTALALVATPFATATAIGPAGYSSTTMVTNDFALSTTCGAKNPAVNLAIQAYCSSTSMGARAAGGLAIGSPFARAGMIHDGYKVSIVGPKCPANSKWVPAKYCAAQFHYMCAYGGAKGAAVTTFGNAGCQIWTIAPV